MNASDDLTYMANLYMALGDRTRLRILNLLRNGEVCVGDFSAVLGDSQPKISRHLAYLRNLGVVDTRRDGKWIFYYISQLDDPFVRNIIAAALNSLSTREICATDTDRYASSFTAGPGKATSTVAMFNNTYVETYMNDVDEADDEPTYSSHNELDEFLL